MAGSVRSGGRLVQAVSHFFTQGDRRRGEEYFQSAAVEFVGFDVQRLHLRVKGSRWYDVILDWRQQYQNHCIKFGCTCPRFDDGLLCKHVYAACLAADVAGVTDSAQRAKYRSWDFADEVDELDEADEDAARTKKPGGRSKSRGAKAPRPPAPPAWQQMLDQWRKEVGYLPPPRPRAPVERASETRFGICAGSDYGRSWAIVPQHREQLKSGGWGVWKSLRPSTLAEKATDPRALFCAQLLRSLHLGGAYYRSSYGYAEPTFVSVDERLTPLFWRQAAGWADVVWLEHHHDDRPDPPRLEYDGDAPYELRLAFERPSPQEVCVVGRLVRGDESLPVTALAHCDSHGYSLVERRIVRLSDAAAARWPALLQARSLTAAATELDPLIARLAELPGAPVLELPAESGWEYERRSPTPICAFKKSDWKTDLVGSANCSYGPPRKFDNGQRWLALKEERRLIERDPAAEARLAQEFKAAVRAAKGRCYDEQAYVNPAQFQQLAARLLKLGWQVEAVGQPVRTLGQMHLNVDAGIDWFDLQVACDFGGVAATLPELLAALRTGQSLIPLGDGTLGMLPDDWLRKFAPLLDLGEAHDGAIRFRSAQAALLDALLAAQDASAVVGRLDELRKRLRTFEGIEPVEEPAGFVGELRPYQRQGLGRLKFWQQSGLGGCLADDMGLGKTIQVLALLLADKRGQRGSAGPALIVAPKSLTYNWREEAARFAPELRVGEYLGGERKALLKQAADFDVLLTTYGVLRLDVAQLCKQPFRYAILDEAQAIKNADSQSAKAARLLKAEHRLVLTGTPVENRLGDLWSLVEFLNPGMLGRGETFRRLLGKSAPDEATLQLLGRAMRPIILRRTKGQVLTELPEKTEQTLYCDLSPEERRRYDELRDHYRAALGQKIQKLGWNKAKIVVLEALLRLRQAACHHGLLDKQRQAEGSAKLDLLLEQLEEVRAEGHQALVFSQFTQFLGLVRKKLDAAGVKYAYLDGKTRDRQAVVEQFQQDPSVSAFLISLKAGGVGLNLTAAEYVFLLDPWWNPAVEAQAIDRAHRIGQQRPVFAYRLIARDTVEEKVLLLQQSKRKLADAIVAAEGAALAELTAEDLQLLLS